MRLQFAAFEAMAALLISSFMLAASYSAMNSFTWQASSSALYVRENAAFYDFQAQLQSNSSMRTCILGMQKNGACAGAYLAAYREVYDVGNVSIYFNGTSAGTAGHALGAYYKCTAFESYGVSAEACIAFGG